MNRILCIGGKLVLTKPYHGLMKNLRISIFAFVVARKVPSFDQG